MVGSRLSRLRRGVPRSPSFDLRSETLCVLVPSIEQPQVERKGLRVLPPRAEIDPRGGPHTRTHHNKVVPLAQTRKRFYLGHTWIPGCSSRQRHRCRDDAATRCQHHIDWQSMSGAESRISQLLAERRRLHDAKAKRAYAPPTAWAPSTQQPATTYKPKATAYEPTATPEERSWGALRVQGMAGWVLGASEASESCTVCRHAWIRAVEEAIGLRLGGLLHRRRSIPPIGVQQPSDCLPTPPAVYRLAAASCQQSARAQRSTASVR